MRLYVHFEAPDEALAWTKRLALSEVSDDSACPTLRSVLCCFFAAYNSKFRPKPPLELGNVDIFVEVDQNANSRRRVEALDMPIASCSTSESRSNKSSPRIDKSCNFELVLVPREIQRKVRTHEPLLALGTKKVDDNQLNFSVEGNEDCGILKLAATYMGQQNFRAAREIYMKVMIKEPHNAEALVALGDILVASGRREEAIRNYYSKCWKAHKEKDCASKARAQLMLTSALKLAQCYIALEKFYEAMMITNEMQTFLRRTSCEKIVGMKEQIDVLKAQALYETKDFDNQEQAISLLVHVLPDLTASTLNLDALLVYSRIAHDRGRKTEALSMVLRVLVGKSTDRGVKKTLVSFLADTNSIDRLKEAVPVGSPSAGAAYAFIATILKDFGAVDQAIACFKLAQASDPQNASYALNHAHALETCCKYAEAYDLLTTFLRQNSALSVGNGEKEAIKMLTGLIVEILARTNAWNDTCDVDGASGAYNPSKELRWSEDWVSGKAGYAKVTPPSLNSKLELQDLQIASPSLCTKHTQPIVALSEADLDHLACFFTIVKILFINGRLSVLPSLIRVLEPIRKGRELHRTTIRNEQAYYACIAQLLSIGDALVISPPQVSLQTSPNSIYVCGDSHTLATAWRSIDLHGQETLLRPALVTGLKHWHLRKESTFYPKLNFWRVVMNIPKNSRVIFLFGEIDCREGILDAVKKCKYDTIEEGMIHTIDIFMKVLSDVVKQCQFDVFIHPIVPVLDETRALVIQYNKNFHKRVANSSICRWLDFFDDLISGDPPKLRPEFRLDGTHLHPSYLSKVEAALTKATSLDKMSC